MHVTLVCIQVKMSVVSVAVFQWTSQSETNLCSDLFPLILQLPKCKQSTTRNLLSAYR